MTRVTLRDVATRAGVSPATASLVLTGNTKARVAASTRARIERAADDLAYRPNQVARGLLSNRTRTLALVSDMLATDPFTGPLVHGASLRAAQSGHLLFVAETDDLGTGVAAEIHLIHRLIDQGVDGFLFAPAARRVVQVPDLPRGVPAVLLNGISTEHADPSHPSVLPDDEKAGRDIAHALAAAGHRHGIHFVGEVLPQGPAGGERLRGLVDGLAEHGIELAAHHRTPWWPEPVRAALTPILSGAEPPTAIIAINDRTALGVYESLARAGLRIPEDVSVVSFDDSFLASWLDPGLTSAELPYAEMGRTAVDLLLQRLQQDAADWKPSTVTDAAATTLRLPMPLHLRPSLGPPRDHATPGHP